MYAQTIPRGDTRRLRTNRGIVIVDRVSDLTDPVTEGWDEQLVDGIFCDDDVKDILSIPIRGGMDDQVAWHYVTKGIFSIKFAYHAGTRIRNAGCNRDASAHLVHLRHV